MVHVEEKDLYKKEYSFLWCVLSFKAGMLNAAGFLIAGSYVSHVTGFGTQMGIAIGHHQVDFGIELLIIPVMFILGGVVTSLVLDSAYSENEVPRYPLVQALITLLLGIISLLFYFGVFSTHGLNQQSMSALVLIGMLCFTCGLKNGLTCWATHGKIRTTHLTGLATDIGLHLPKAFWSKGAKYRYPEPVSRNRMRILILFSFSLGSCLSALLIQIIEYKVFYLSFCISAVLLVVSVLHRKFVAQGREAERELVGNST